MNIFQIAIIAFIAYAIFKMIYKLKNKVITIPIFLIWMILWLGIGVLGLFPGILTYLAELVGVGRGVDLAIYIAILIILYVIFKIYLRLEKFDRNLSEIVQKISVSKANKPKQND